MSKVLKNILFLVIIVILAAAAYFIFFAKDEAGQPLLQRTSVLFGEGPQLGERSQFLGVLLNIKSIRLDVSIFDTEAFKNLDDFTVPIISFGNEGRPNPFAPLGFDEVLLEGGEIETEGTFILEEIEEPEETEEPEQ
ncbi:hypothetical protein A3A09_02020 [Candidatus Nomurabacteria bacterium RIFCSPLOWO2_01_FULL_42_20]|uniref:Uncharacterized protein n=1 Tax=Candidatus Nomurabacteria bacterium RIFCSPHIGHO2_01_FULL_42_16 TaxID=1801743 RepID=A0A1F6VK25_9BACT|nr:MAG: hypothetical protein A2824_03655 [Candidatus Nomurabacteria bacterium RIFCSPHIGHO2_01_FULL_42_16]OGI92167.1 MAG: hypothetical protein A3A09_02020 [Candidatus Nomurabacteria bacterium RIFCSPLOWO2_01_FULL_42_20]